MKSRPILFSAPMVRALLDGSKTQTRRVVKLPHQNPLGVWEPFDWGGPNGGHTAKGEAMPFQQTIAHTRTGEIIGCPYGQPGDQLWVREGFRTEEGFDDIKPSLLEVASNGKTLALPFWYDANLPSKDFSYALPGLRPGKYRPGMFMPRAASRITLEITGVRVERLTGISEADALAEGVDMNQLVTMPMFPGAPCTVTIKPRNAVEAYAMLWESINGPGLWAANPWVWCIEFRRLAP